MGQSRGADDVKIRRRQTPSLPIHKSIISRSAQKQKWWKNYQYTSALKRERLELFVAQFFLLIGSVFTEQSRICVTNAKPAMLEQGDLFWQGNLTHCLCQGVMKTHILLTNDPAQEEDLLQRYQERVEKLSQQNRVIIFCTDAGFLTTVDVGQYFMTQDTKEFSQFTDSVACREYTPCQKMKNHLTRKVGFEGTP